MSGNNIAVQSTANNSSSDVVNEKVEYFKSFFSEKEEEDGEEGEGDGTVHGDNKKDDVVLSVFESIARISE